MVSETPQPGRAPDHIMNIEYGDEPPVMITVDGQVFRVRARAKEPGTYDFDWLNGPQRYGFGLSRAGRPEMSRAEMEEAIGDFLAQINPATGYLD